MKDGRISQTILPSETGCIWAVRRDDVRGVYLCKRMSTVLHVDWEMDKQYFTDHCGSQDDISIWQLEAKHVPFSSLPRDSSGRVLEFFSLASSHQARSL